MPDVPERSSSSRLILIGACLFAALLICVVILARDRERRAAEQSRKQATFAMLELKDDVDAANAAMVEFNLDGALDFEGLEETTALERRIALAALAQANVERVLKNGDAARDRLAGKVDWPRNRIVYQAHRDAYAAARAQLEFMRDHAGHWRADAVGRSVQWDSAPLAAEAERLARRVESARVAQEALASRSTSPPTTRSTPPN